MNLDATKVLIGKSSSKKDANTEKQLRPGGWVFREIDMTVFHVTDPKELQMFPRLPKSPKFPTTLVLHGTRIIADHCILLTLIIINDILDEIYKTCLENVPKTSHFVYILAKNFNLTNFFDKKFKVQILHRFEIFTKIRKNSSNFVYILAKHCRSHFNSTNFSSEFVI